MVARRARGEGNIGQRRADGLWYGRIDLGRDTAGKRRSRTVYCRTREGAESKLQALLDAQGRGVSPALDRVTVGDYLAGRIEGTVRPTVRPRTFASYSQIVRVYLAPVLGHHELRRLEPTHIQGMLNRLTAEGKSPRTARYALAVLRRALGRTVLWGQLLRNVALLVTPPAAIWHEQSALSWEQSLALLAAARGQRHEALYRIALTLGLRLGEVLGLRWADIDLDIGTLRVAQTVQRIGGRIVFGEPKTRRSRRTLPMSAALAQSLVAHRERHEAERSNSGAGWHAWGLVFTTRHGTPLEPRNVVRSFKALLVRAGLPDIRFHDLRHTCASLLVAAGHHPRVVMETLGHSQIGITMDTYAHVCAGALNAVAETMDELLPLGGSLAVGDSE